MDPKTDASARSYGALIGSEMDTRPTTTPSPQLTFTLDGIVQSPTVKGVPDFRWTYDGVDPHGVYIRAIIAAESVDSAVRIISAYFPSFVPTTVRPGVHIRENQTVWFGNLPAKKRRNWLVRIFTRTQDL